MVWDKITFEIIHFRNLCEKELMENMQMANHIWQFTVTDENPLGTDNHYR